MNYAGAVITEYRHFTNPSDPNNSDFMVVFFRTVMEAIIDRQTNRTLAEILSADEGSLFTHIADTELHLTPGQMDSINQIVAELVAFTQQDFLSGADRDTLNQLVSDMAAALALAQGNAGLITDMRGQIAQLQESIFHAITANPFMVTFANLNGIMVTRGIWNAAYHRIEC